ncbi:MAG TPA: hypothetical protein VFH80_03835 [Solirubrobacteraceae bacterium]|nr:hypothetical protein [Solirubrobacteraceae bacterium]
MRKRERDQLLTVVDSMLDGARQLPYLEPASVRRMAGDILAAVPLLDAPGYEGAREEIERTAERLRTAAGADTSSVEHELIGQLRALKQRLRADANITYTVVFMPYNASMWDSLHTIWAAADADPRVEAIVVPIPYADRLPDGSAGAWHVHTNDLPSEVRVTPYTEFDLQATHPDVIYVHNPYDGNNRVTSVAPQFYSAELRPHTDLLVYVPYYVSPTTPGEHLYLSPSFELFDKVIVQSEEIDQPVIEKWTSNKVVPLGSPKFDYVRTPGSPPPPDWTESMRGRIALLQVTSLSTLLDAERQAFMRKLNEVLDLVEASEDLMLWWRPHPLERATIASMVPDIDPLYTAYEQRARRSDRVIVDTSMDLQRAIHNTHGYYGHWSSVVDLFGFTGKPMVIQDANVETNVPRPEGPADTGPNAALTAYARPEWFVFEGAIEYLRRMLSQPDGRVPGQHEYFASLTAHADGTAGKHIHEYVMSCLASD